MDTIVFVLALVGAIAAAPAPQSGGLVLGVDPRQATVIRDVRTQEFDAYTTDVETDNGILIQEQGGPGQAGQVNVQGTYSWRAPDGSIVTLIVLANESGAQVQSPSGHLPVGPVNPHPMPAHAVEQVRFAEAQRARGLTYDGENDRWV